MFGTKFDCVAIHLYVEKKMSEKSTHSHVYISVDSADIRVQFYILMNGCVTVSSMLMELIILYYYLIF